MQTINHTAPRRMAHSAIHPLFVSHRGHLIYLCPLCSCVRVAMKLRSLHVHPPCVMVFQYNPTLSVGLSLNSNDTLSFLSTNRAESAPLVQSSKLLLVLYILI